MCFNFDMSHTEHLICYLETDGKKGCWPKIRIKIKIHYFYQIKLKLRQLFRLMSRSLRQGFIKIETKLCIFIISHLFDQ